MLLKLPCFTKPIVCLQHYVDLVLKCRLHTPRHNVREIYSWNVWTFCNTVIASIRSTFQIVHQILAISDAVYCTVHGHRPPYVRFIVQLADLK